MPRWGLALCLLIPACGGTTTLGSTSGGGGSPGGSGGAPAQGSAFEVAPGAVVQNDGGSVECPPPDHAGAQNAGTGWSVVSPGPHHFGCGSLSLTALDINAVYSKNTPDVVRTWGGIGPPYPWFASDALGDCAQPPAETLFFTAGVPEQLVIFDHAVHVDDEQQMFSSTDIYNRTRGLLAGESDHYLLTSVPPVGLICGRASRLAEVKTTWDLGPGEEMKACVRRTLEFDHDARFVRIESPTGTHRSAFSIGSPTGPDGTSNCDESADAELVLGYGVDGGRVEARLWDGHVAAGQQLVLRVHAMNTSGERRKAAVSAALD